MKESDNQKKSEQENLEQIKKQIVSEAKKLLDHPNLSDESKAMLVEAGVTDFIK